ncbi:hypothetical protein ABZ471_33805 [Streptomyces sp. NPDC005728]|uniref:hypothetical protein n=1 Tax=Streptomyces sp. NPDC005728 TaxID=3157054 RepID=UPI00340DF355
MNDGDHCTASLPEHPLAGRVLPVSVVAALAAASAAGWITWVASCRRAHPAVLYAVWLATVAVAVVVSLAPQLRAARTRAYN